MDDDPGNAQSANAPSVEEQSADERSPDDVGARFRTAWMGSGDPETAVAELLPVRLARACLQVLPVAGAGLSLLNDSFRVPLGANDDTASLAERLQFTQGEGPCLDAARSQRLLVASIDDMEATWPLFAQELLRHTPYSAIISVPLDIAPGLAGALDLFATDMAQINDVSLVDATTVTGQIVDALRIAQAIAAPGASWTDESGPDWLHGSATHRRTQVYVAMGMAMTRFDVPATDALALLRAYAYGHDRNLDDIAAALVDGDLDVAQIKR